MEDGGNAELGTDPMCQVWRAFDPNDEKKSLGDGILICEKLISEVSDAGVASGLAARIGYADSCISRGDSKHDSGSCAEGTSSDKF